MIAKLTIALLIGFLPLHDFHTSLMNISYEADKKSFEIDLTVDTEHFEEAVNATYYTDIRLGELNEHDSCDFYIDAYINKHISAKFNKRNKKLKLAVKEVNYAETTLHFEDVCFKRKLKYLEMENTFLMPHFPSNKNLIKIHYKEQSESMLFDKTTDWMITFFN